MKFSKQTSITKSLPEGFGYLTDTRIILTLNYFTNNNFIGRQVKGYNAKKCILTIDAINSLTKVQDELDTYKKGYRLSIFDAYRPQTSVNDLIAWQYENNNDLKQKEKYYPNLTKNELFEKAYIMKKSEHTRGSAVDLTIVYPDGKNPKNYIEMDMGTIIDFFGEQSNINYKGISDNAKKNRLFLKTIMENHGFKNYPLEWWHYSLKNEPFPDTYFDFMIN